MNLPEHIALIFSVLRREIGLDPESVGHRSLEAAVERRAQELELSLDAYALRVQTSSEERRALIERVVVPETWFFRDRAPFDFLARVANAEWRHRDRQVRVLSIPCSTGEEPYSISMCFLDQGIPPACFAIEACDISEAALERARRASYTAIAFRGSDLNYRDRHFVPLPDGRFELEPRARAPVTFRYANILDLDKLAPPASFDAIFSRNLLIYLEPDIREKAAESFFMLLRPSGYLFVGHAETLPIFSRRFEPVEDTAAFAYRVRAAPRSRPAAARPNPRPIHAKTSAVRPVSPASSRPHPLPVASSPAAAPGLPRSAWAVKLAEARTAADRGNYSLATALCRDVLSIEPGSAETHCLLGLALCAAGDDYGGEEALRRALYLDPRNADALFHLALLVEKRGRTDEAATLRDRLRQT